MKKKSPRRWNRELSQKGRRNVSPNYRKAEPNATNLKLIKSKVAALHLGGLAPSDAMEPGDYVVGCQNAWTEPRGRNTRIVWQHRIIDGEHTGVALRQWLTVADASGEVAPDSPYLRYCEIALGRPINVTDNLNDPAVIFKGKYFRVFVGYRKSERAGGGGKNSDDYALRRKDDRDYLKVHEILALEEL
jgi:hypothetical protein